MSPAHGTLIKISNCMHLCLLAGLLKRQRPQHPSLPPSFITRRYYVCHPKAWVGEWPVPTKIPSFCHSLISHFEVRIVPVLRDKEGYEMTWLVASARILKTRNVVSVLPVACTDMLQSIPFFSQLKKSEYYYPLNIV